MELAGATAAEKETLVQAMPTLTQLGALNVDAIIRALIGLPLKRAAALVARIWIDGFCGNMEKTPNWTGLPRFKRLQQSKPSAA